MRIMFINNHGGGFADYIDIEASTTVGKLFAEKIPGGRAEDYLIRVNRLPTSRDQILQEGDRVTITPTKIEGAVV
ncbi:MAG TPA: molybdopterin converting factor [Phycisphaerae bacterium]|nr:molybdopterin converting factor [Phycisphaerae bacterium]